MSFATPPPPTILTERKAENGLATGLEYQVRRPDGIMSWVDELYIDPDALESFETKSSSGSRANAVHCAHCCQSHPRTPRTPKALPMVRDQATRSKPDFRRVRGIVAPSTITRPVMSAAQCTR